MELVQNLLDKDIRVTLVGVSFNADRVRLLTVGEKVMVLPEPSNQYDPNARLVCTLAGEPLGYLPANIARRFTEENRDERFVCEVVELRSHEGTVVGAEIVFLAPAPDQGSV